MTLNTSSAGGLVQATCLIPQSLSWRQKSLCMEKGTQEAPSLFQAVPVGRSAAVPGASGLEGFSELASAVSGKGMGATC